MWYTVQAAAGKEEEFLDRAKTRFDRTLCQDCLILKIERLKRLGGRWIIQAEPLFPGYVFVRTDNPKALNRYLELAKSGHILEGGREEFLPLESEEEKLFLFLTKGNREPVVRLTEVKISEAGEILSMKGMLEHFRHQIQKVNLRKRYAIISVPISGKEKKILFGICLEKDQVRQELQYECKSKVQETEMTAETGDRKEDEKGQKSAQLLETCVLCGKVTDVPVEQEIERRAFYIEGAGQLCYDCYQKIYR